VSCGWSPAISKKMSPEPSLAQPCGLLRELVGHTPAGVRWFERGRVNRLDVSAMKCRTAGRGHRERKNLQRFESVFRHGCSLSHLVSPRILGL
jgi:hypothetical protein